MNPLWWLFFGPLGLILLCTLASLFCLWRAGFALQCSHAAALMPLSARSVAVQREFLEKGERWNRRAGWISPWIVWAEGRDSAT